MKAPALFYTGVLLFVGMSLNYCQPGNPDAQVSPQVGITLSKETARYRDAAATSLEPVTWTEGTAAGSNWAGSDSERARNEVYSVLKRSAVKLAAIDYSALALPDFVTVTKALIVTPSVFNGGDLSVDAYAKGNDPNQKWVLYEWHGPQFPQLPARPLVHRWLYVYALYDLTTGQVVRLVPTIHGEAIE